MIDIAESPISRTGNREWDDTFNKCFYDNMSTVVWAHGCMFGAQSSSVRVKSVLGVVPQKSMNRM